MGGDDMKEAAGEANMTVITIVLIGVVAAAGAILIPRITKSLNNKSCCSESGGLWYQNSCYVANTCNIDSATGKVNNCTKGTTFTPSCD